MKKNVFIFLSGVLGFVSGMGFTKYLNSKNQKQDRTYKFKAYYETLNQWLMLKNQGISLERYFIKNNYINIAIYGMGEMGTRLYEELKDTNINIKYAIDQNGGLPYSDLLIYNIDDDFERIDVDVIVVSAIFDFQSIEKKLHEKREFNLVSLEELVFSI